MKSFIAQAPPVSLSPPPTLAIGYDAIVLGVGTFILGSAIALGRALIIREIKRFETRLEYLEKTGPQYVTREDYVRNATVTEAKLDAVHRRLDEIMVAVMRSGQ